MKTVMKTVRNLVMMLLVCAMLTTFVFAADTGSAWLNVMQTSTDEGATAYIVTDTTVTDGLVELTYDSEALTYEGIEVNGDYVAMYAVNADTAGVVKISWVAPNAYETGEAVWLVRVSFAGVGDVALSGTMNDADGNAVAQGENLNASELEKVILEAEGLYEDNYTRKTWKTMEEDLEAAKAVLADPTATQEEVDAATAALRESVDGLELKKFTNNIELYKAILRGEGLCESFYTEETWAVLEDALANAKAVMNDRNATQQQVDEATAALNDAICGLELKCYCKPPVPEVPEVPEETQAPTGPEVTEPSVPETTAPAEEPEEDKGGWLDKIKNWFGGWFGSNEPEETTVPETTVPETTVPETTAPAEEPEENKGGWFDWIRGWFGWGK